MCSTIYIKLNAPSPTLPIRAPHNTNRRCQRLDISPMHLTERPRVHPPTTPNAAERSSKYICACPAFGPEPCPARRMCPPTLVAQVRVIYLVPCDGITRLPRKRRNHNHCLIQKVLASSTPLSAISTSTPRYHSMC